MATVGWMTGMPSKEGEESKYILDAGVDSSWYTCYHVLHFTKTGFAYEVKMVETSIFWWESR